MATILYLDADDEITSAAARIRAASETKVALVLPPGSRLATSRINFRLLAREGLERNRVLSIVAADPAARAIAASAGLPVYQSVAEFEATIAPPTPPPPPPEVTPSPEAAPGKRGGRRRRSAGEPATGAAGAAGTTAVGGAASTGAGGAEQLSADLVAPSVPATPAVTTRPSSPPPSAPPPSIPPPVVAPPTETRARSSAATIPVIPAARIGGGFSGRLLVTLGVLLVAILVLAVAGYVLLPSATVVVTSVAVPIRPVEFVVRADPDATSVDPVGGVIPATRLTRDFNAASEFEATGKRIVQAKATGTLRWRNCDPVRSYTVPAGTLAETGSGIGFETEAAVFLPVATLTGDPPKLTCQARDVRARAVKPGPSGNVGAGTVTVVPSSFNSVVIKVANPAAMAGGKREEFTRIQQKDIDAAIASLTKDLAAQFDAWAAAPDELPAGATAFPATGNLGAAVPSVDPTTLLNLEQPTFQLAATATGTVVAVDSKLVDQVAGQRIAANIPAKHTLQEGSVTSSHDGGQADGELVDFRVTASASAVPVLDPAALREEIKGKPVDEARRILERYGTVTIDTWPGFVGSIPTLDARLDLTVAGAQGPAGQSPAPSGSAP